MSRSTYTPPNTLGYEECHIIALKQYVELLREDLLNHPLYDQVKTLEDLRIFMEHHVFAVWDFLSLVKSLQIKTICHSAAWTPRIDPAVRRLINEITLQEESDESMESGFASHLEIYLEAMTRAGADMSAIREFLDRIGGGQPVLPALDAARPPEAAQSFVESTWRIIETGGSHQIAAAIAVGREDLISSMFQKLLNGLDDRFQESASMFSYYLERHLKPESRSHSPLGWQMLSLFCEEDPRKWEEAEEVSRRQLLARLRLWDAISTGITSKP